MDKRVVSIAVVIAMSAPATVNAEAILYGRINNSAVYTDASEKAVDEAGNVFWRDPMNRGATPLANRVDSLSSTSDCVN